MAGRFNVTYDVTTPESAEHGDYAESGFMAEDVTLREALQYIGYSTSRPGLQDSGNWFSTVDPDRDYSDGSETYYAIHPPRTVTAASYGRLVRVLTR